MAQKKTFEQSIERLEAITEEMEKGELPLEEALKLFDEGMKLCRFCNQKLDEAEQKVSLMLATDDGIHQEPFPPMEQEDER